MQNTVEAVLNLFRDRLSPMLLRVNVPSKNEYKTLHNYKIIPTFAPANKNIILITLN